MSAYSLISIRKRPASHSESLFRPGQTERHGTLLPLVEANSMARNLKDVGLLPMRRYTQLGVYSEGGIDGIDACDVFGGVTMRPRGKVPDPVYSVDIVVDFGVVEVVVRCVDR